MRFWPTCAAKWIYCAALSTIPTPEHIFAFRKRSKLSRPKFADRLGFDARAVQIGNRATWVWTKKYAQIGVSELRELKQLREDNTGLKRLVADLTLDKQILTDVVKKKP